MNILFNDPTTMSLGLFILISFVGSIACCVFAVCHNKIKTTTTGDIEISNETIVTNLNEEEYLPKYTPREELPQYSNV